MELSYRQKCDLYDRGFVKIEGVVPRAMVDAALRAINHSMGEGMAPERMPIFRAQSYCPEIQREPVITDLLNRTPAWSLAESAIGSGRIQPVTGAQVALRFPNLNDEPGRASPHIDGMHSPTNGVPQGQILNFTALAGILLSDVPGPNAGNFTVWPGSHHLLQAHFQEHGPESLLAGLPQVSLGEPMQITGKAGDIVIAHYELAHGVTPNVSPSIRYAIFFRLHHVDHDAHRWESMTDIWLQWEGMREVAAQRRDRAAV